ncbi:MAG: hypothetical protein WCD00_10600, partial [Desulfuromonadaceae bacterium]
MISFALRTSMEGVDQLNCFKAYDIRGHVPDELNDDVAYRLGRAYADEFSSRTVIVGRDVRLESPSLSA